MTASAAGPAYDGKGPEDDTLVFDQIEVWPDEIRIGDIFGGFVITAVARSDHYREPAVRLTIFTDPDAVSDGTRSEEWGRIVLRTDRSRGHKVPVDRPIPR